MPGQKHSQITKTKTLSATQVNFPKVVQKAIADYISNRSKQTKDMEQSADNQLHSPIESLRNLINNDSLLNSLIVMGSIIHMAIASHLNMTESLPQNAFLLLLAKKTLEDAKNTFVEDQLCLENMLLGTTWFIKPPASAFLWPLYQKWHNSHTISPRKQLVSAKQEMSHILGAINMIITAYWIMQQPAFKLLLMTSSLFTMSRQQPKHSSLEGSFWGTSLSLHHKTGTNSILNYETVSLMMETLD